MTRTSRRLILYGAASAVAVGLAMAGTWEPPADPLTVLLQAEVKLRFASRLPPADADGKPVAARTALIAAGEEFVDQAAALAPDLGAVSEYRGYIAYLRGDPAAAAGHYRRARSGSGLDEEQRQDLWINEARMLRLMGDEEQALAMLRAERPRFAGSRAIQASVEEAAILMSLGRPADALPIVAAAAAAATDADDTEGMIRAGEMLEELGSLDAAEASYRGAAACDPIGNYFTARLKLRQGDFDNALDMLERAVKDRGSMVRRLARRDASLWSPCADTERFRMLVPEHDE